MFLVLPRNPSIIMIWDMALVFATPMFRVNVPFASTVGRNDSLSGSTMQRRHVLPSTWNNFNPGKLHHVELVGVNSQQRDFS